MANRYWVGGTANWDATAGSKWALTSGGTGGEAVPTAADDVFFDANSGTVSVIKSGSGTCLSLNFTGFTGTFAGTGALAVSGSLTMASGMTRTYTGKITFNATSTGHTVTSNGINFSGDFAFDGVGGGWTLQDDFTNIPDLVQGIALTNGTLDTNGKTVNVAGGTINISGTGTRTLTLGASTISGVRFWTATTTTNLTFNANTSTIILASGTAAKTFEGGGLTYNKLTIPESGTSLTVTMNGSNTFSNFTINPGVGVTINFTAGTTQTVSPSGFICLGNNKRITLKSTSNGSAWTISIASGTTRITNASLQDSTATGGATFRAENTTDVSGNSGWSFGNLSGFFPFF